MLEPRRFLAGLGVLAAYQIRIDATPQGWTATLVLTGGSSSDAILLYGNGGIDASKLIQLLGQRQGTTQPVTPTPRNEPQVVLNPNTSVSGPEIPGEGTRFELLPVPVDELVALPQAAAKSKPSSDPVTVSNAFQAGRFSSRRFQRTDQADPQSVEPLMGLTRFEWDRARQTSQMSVPGTVGTAFAMEQSDAASHARLLASATSAVSLLNPSSGSPFTVRKAASSDSMFRSPDVISEPAARPGLLDESRVRVGAAVTSTPGLRSRSRLRRRQPLAAGSSSTILLALPLCVAAVISLVACVWSITHRLTRPFPLTPWESSIVLDAVRFAQGVPIYESLGHGHATHMYGPLTTWLLGTIFQFSDPSFFTVRYVSLTAAMIFTALLVFTFSHRRDVLSLLIAVAMVASLHYRCRAYFTEARPDLLALLFATLALIAAYRAAKHQRFVWYLASAGLAVIAFLFKQPYAACAMVPPVALVLERATRQQILASLIPLGAIVVTLIVLRIGWPTVWFYMIAVPSQYEIQTQRIQVAIMSLLLYNPFFLVTAFVVGVHRHSRLMRDERTVWLAAAVLIGGLIAILGFAKEGGTYNSLLTAFAPMTAFCILALPSLFDLIRERITTSMMRGAAAVLLAMLLAATTFGIPLSDRSAFDLASNNPNYSRTIRIVRSLPGRVLCPEEPTITFFGKGQLERSLDAELDAHGRPDTLPRSMVEYISSADYLIRVHSNFSALGGATDDTVVRWLGFEPAPPFSAGRGYTVWKRTAAPAPTTPQPPPAGRRPARPVLP